MTNSFSARSEKTLPLTVANTGFLLDRMGEDCHPLQFLRELTQNSIESILRTEEKRGEIIWDVDWNYLSTKGVYKLSIIDTGDGMTGKDMVRYINQLSSSVSEQSFVGNYGVGAKIAAATRNPAGLIYLSWRNGRCAMIHLWRDPDTRQYGLRQFQKDDGSFEHYAEVEDDVKPEVISQRGTVVVLLGASEDVDTMAAPDGVPSPSRWISKYLNTRYFKFPDGVIVKAREGWTLPRTDKDRNLLRTIIGQQHYLERHCFTSGSVGLNGATAHWWILKDDNALSQNSGFVESAGHVAALYKDELYELQTARSGMARLQQFGVILGHRRVVIYVEPHGTDSRRVTTNTARTTLMINNEPLPWADWAAEFRDKMPHEIDQLIQEVAAGSSTSDHTKSIRDRLKQILDLYRVSRYKPAPNGPLSIDVETLTRGGKAKHTDTTQLNASSRSGKKGGTAGGVYSIYLKKDGEPGVEVQPDVFPEVRWVSVTDGTREPEDIEDRAGRFLIDQNLLMINADFRVFQDMIDRWCREFEPSTAVREIVIDAVHNWFEQSLVETVIGIQALQKSREWTSEEIAKAISEEALTASVMPRYHVNNSVKRELGSKLGKFQQAAS